MSDLISRSKVISVLEQLEEHSLSGKMDISNAIYLLKKQPTAYDIDKVVEELKELKAYAVYEDINADTKWLNKAIEIVKQGGVSDDECFSVQSAVCTNENTPADVRTKILNRVRNELNAPKN